MEQKQLKIKQKQLHNEMLEKKRIEEIERQENEIKMEQRRLFKKMKSEINYREQACDSSFTQYK